MSQSFSHINESNEPQMVNIGEKPTTNRIAKAQALVYLGENILSQLQSNQFQVAKGPVFSTAILAGIMASKKTAELIPLCHSLPLDGCEVEMTVVDHSSVKIITTASTNSKTGVEMEALTAASIAALTLYDMCKSMSHHIRITEIKLLEKSGGKSHFVATE